MGYIPPVKDEQPLQYVNRQSKPSSSVKSLSVTQRTEFLATSEQDRHDRLNYVFRTRKVREKTEDEKEFEKEFTGRGEHIDSSI
ncbi:hypothetical protein [Salisediminibacterium selenitireducens]|uniref:Uncharacterized protein n=1 Tax=Bacillus selenitireducens (strain ATCC 700615 / DSM 15326 / MLS10) TaxID=439292 RepID=D6XTD4_BACIE|nr:hypothetical protein [Salisediminibacterium selenitireducens]ADH99070.1 hypothetical protein Bsel_1558 [[Bacillus] selenitireducens MLS10]